MDREHGCCCGHERHRPHHFLTVSLLLLLSEEGGHGYALLDRLEAFGFEKEQFNVGSLYRSLRKMEREGAVSSGWEEGGTGPRRRVYQITETGKEQLAQWIRMLTQRKRRIESLLARYETK